jgi:hypothetical protein
MAELIAKQVVKDLATVYTSLLLDLPLASVRQGTGRAKEKETAEAVWKGYDAGIRLATAALDTLYHSSPFGEAMSRTLDGMFRWQQTANAVSGTMLIGMWRALGISTAAEVRGISEQLQTLEARVTAQSMKKEVQTLRERTQRLEIRINTPPQAQEQDGPSQFEERAAA